MQDGAERAMQIKAVKKKNADKACCLSGPVPLDLPFGFDEECMEATALIDVLQREIESLIIKGCEHFVSGMEWGIEILAAERVILLREKYPSVKLTCVIPYEEQAAKWNEESRNRYFEVIEQADDMKLIGMRYHENCYAQRDQSILRMCNKILVIVDEDKQGRKPLVEQAIQSGMEIVLIHPRTHAVRHLAGHRNFKLI